MTVIERVARVIASVRGANPDECVHGYGWAAGEMGKSEGGSVCHRRRWQDFIPEARAALEALREHRLEVRDEGGVVHQLVGAPDDLWKTLLTAALNEPRP